MTGIYKITSPTGSIYIGKSRNIKKRWGSYNAMNKNTIGRKLLNSLKKYGINNHKFEVVSHLPEDINELVLTTYEIFYWQRYVDCGASMLNSVQPSIIPKRRKGVAISAETKEKIRSKLKGVKHSKERIESIKIGVHKNNPNGLPPVWNKGKRGIYSEETINKIKNARAKQVFTKDSIRKAAESRKFTMGLKIEYNGNAWPLKRICEKEGINYKNAHSQLKKSGKNIYQIIQFYKNKKSNEDIR